MGERLQGDTDSFPFEAVRDLLGIVRAMYAAAKADGAGERQLGALRRAGTELREAIEAALRSDPGTPPRAEAWARADRATERVGDLVDAITPLEPTIVAAVRRVRSASPVRGREIARRARIARG